MELREVTLLAVVVRIIVSFLLGGILGMERGLKQRPAGLRTYMLVCLGACMIMLTNEYIVQVYGSGDPARMAAQVVSGIGFLGAGTIIVTRHSQIKGLTTAAGLWAAAAVGLATGIGFYEAAIVGALVIFMTLSVLSGLDSRMHRRTDHFEVYIELPESVSLGMLMDALNVRNITLENAQFDAHHAYADGSRSFLLELTTQKRFTRPEMLEELHKATTMAELTITGCRMI